MLIALVIIGIVCVLSNGIPMKIGGIANDGYNILSISTEDGYAIINEKINSTENAVILSV